MGKKNGREKKEYGKEEKEENKRDG